MPLPSTMTPIANITLSSNTTPVTFNNIPQTYTDLLIVANARGSSDIESDINIIFNGDTAANYSDTRMYADANVGSDRHTNYNYIIVGRQGATTFAPNIIHIMNYTNTNMFKTVISRSGHSNVITMTNVGIWRSTSAITSISFTQGGAQSYKSGSSFTIYGIKAAP